VDQSRNRSADDLLGALGAEEFRPGGVDEEHHAFGVNGDGVWREFHDPLEALLGFTQPLLRQPGLGVVAQYLGEPTRAARPVAQQHQHAVGPEARAVLAQVPTLVLGTPLPQRRLHLQQVGTPLAVFRGEDD
jgi:hypothetical protein